MQRNRTGRAIVALSGSLALAISVSAQESRIPLPFAREWAAGSPLPRPVGVGVTYYTQDQDYRLTSVEVGGAAAAALGGAGGLVPVPSEMLTGIAADNSVREINVKLDGWILPFLNVFGLVGALEGETAVDNLSPPLPVTSLDFDYDGVVFGLGATLAGGVGPAFGALTATYTDTSLDGSESALTAWILAPKVGIRLDDVAPALDVALWVGGVYQNIEEEQKGRLDIPGMGPVDYAVDLEQEEEWNYAAGATALLDDAWQVDLEAGFGERTHAAASVTFRF